MGWFTKNEPKRDLRASLDAIAVNVASMSISEIERALGEPTNRISSNPNELARMWMSDGFSVFMAWAKNDEHMTKCGVIDPVAFPHGAVKLVDWLKYTHGVE